MEFSGILSCFLRYRLHKAYRESSPVEEGSSPKIKFSTVQSAYCSETGAGVSDYSLSRAVSKVFPHATAKRIGKKRVTYIHGIQSTAPASMLPPTTEDVAQEGKAQEDIAQEGVAQVQSDVQRLRQLNTELQRKVEDLEYKIAAMEQQATYTTELTTQMFTMMQRGTCIASGPDTQEHFENFSLDAVIAELKAHAPSLYQLFLELGDVRRVARDDSDAITVQTMKATASLWTLLNARSSRVKGFQLLMGLMLVARATSRQVRMRQFSSCCIRQFVIALSVQAMEVLNYTGVCMSYHATWGYLRQLTTEAQYVDVVKEGHWQWVYDNINLHQRVRHEREGP